MGSMCVLCSDSASTSNHFYAHWQWPLDKTLAEPRIQPWWMKTVTNYWILSFHCTVNQKQWQTRNSCDELLVQSQPAVPEGNLCPDWPAERLLTHKSSVLTETAHKQPTRPPANTWQKPWQTSLNWKNNNNNNNMRGVVGKGWTVRWLRALSEGGRQWGG